jgi:hypothetical protein
MQECSARGRDYCSVIQSRKNTENITNIPERCIFRRAIACNGSPHNALWHSMIKGPEQLGNHRPQTCGPGNVKKLLIVVHASFSLFWLMSCARSSSKENAFLEPTSSPPVSWNTDAYSRILLATFCCDGPIVQELVHPYIPEAQIWGDGRFHWSVQDADGVRQVFVKQLSTNEMAELLQEIATSGFFDWDEQYEQT